MRDVRRLTNPPKKFAMLLIAALLGVCVAGCGAVESYKKQIVDVWSVTYEVTVTGPSINALDQVSYLQAPARGEKSVESPAESVVTTNTLNDPDTAVWRTTTTVTAEDTAMVTATARAGSTATCRILLDDVKEIQSSTAQTGESVVCQVKTPAFDK